MSPLRCICCCLFPVIAFMTADVLLLHISWRSRLHPIVTDWTTKGHDRSSVFSVRCSPPKRLVAYILKSYNNSNASRNRAHKLLWCNFEACGNGVRTWTIILSGDKRGHTRAQSAPSGPPPCNCFGRPRTNFVPRGAGG